MKVTFIIPVFNEEELLEAVLEKVRALDFQKELVIVDDCSTDGTRRILAQEEDMPDTIVAYHDRNIGKGAAIRTGIKLATGEIMLIQDADMEYDPADLPALIEPIALGKARVVFGSRFKGTIHGMKFPNRVANRILAGIVTFLYFHPLSDEATAYKAFESSLLRSLDLQCNKFEFCPEVTAKAIKAGVRIHEVPINYNARTFEEGKKINYKDFFQAVWTLLRYRFWKLKA